MKNPLNAIFLFLLVTACATIDRPEPIARSEHVTERNYKVGVPQSAFVGDPMVRAKDYWVNTISEPAVSPSEQVTIEPGVQRSVTIPAGQTVPVVGELESGGENFRIVEIHGMRDNNRLLLDANGRLTGQFLNAYNRPTPLMRHDVIPSHVQFESTERVNVLANRTFVNFELIYSGTSGGTINLLYREYSPNDLIRPAFSQNLSYDIGETTIRFRRVLIEVHEADSQSIRYVVLEDGID